LIEFALALFYAALPQHMAESLWLSGERPFSLF